jgi:chorismate dehydratase
MNKLKIGKIAYTNILPVFHFFRYKDFINEVDFIQAVPAELNRQLASGTIDMGPISSFAYAQGADNYLALSDLSVSANKQVRSIFLFTKKPIEELKEPRIALTNSSATSVNLLKVIMQKFYQAHPSYSDFEPDLTQMMLEADAALLIGDDALLANWNNREFLVYDLATLWYQHTGLWMTFALWTIRKEIASTHSELLARIHDEFIRSKSEGVLKLEQIITQARLDFGGAESFWKQYFSGLSFDFGSEQKMGLEYYFRCAADLGLLADPVQVRLWGAKTGAKKT